MSKMIQRNGVLDRRAATGQVVVFAYTDSHVNINTCPSCPSFDVLTHARTHTHSHTQIVLRLMHGSQQRLLCVHE